MQKLHMQVTFASKFQIIIIIIIITFV